jgi:hypothetical protein
MAIGDTLTAGEYFRGAVDLAPKGFYKVMALRTYDFYLFTQRRFDDAREQYRWAVRESSGADNFSRYTNGLTYQLWAFNELNLANSPKDAEACADRARNEFDGIDVKSIKDDALANLERLRTQISMGRVVLAAGPFAGNRWSAQMPPGAPDTQ